MRAIADEYPGWLDQTFLVIYGDLLLDIALDDLRAFHGSSGATLTMVLKRTSTPSTQGMVALDADGRVERFVEKPAAWDHGDLANAGIYLCEPAVLQLIPPGVSDFGHDIIPALIASGARIVGREVQGYLLDIGTPGAYEQAQRDWLVRR